MDDMFNEGSVCGGCWNRDNDKTECVDKCLRLQAYQCHKPWYHIPPYGEIMALKEEVTIPAPMDEYQKKYTEPVKEEPKDAYVAVKVCPTCRIEVGNRRGLCTKCYDKWRKGGLIHPIEGEWKPNRKTKPKKAKKTRKHGISDEALRNVEPSLNAAVKRIEARKETKMDFNDTVEHRIEQIRTVLTQKALEYATDQDRWHNFNRAGEILGISPERALVGMMVKHFVSVMDFVENSEKHPEKLNDAIIDEKIGDLCNYLILLEGLLKKRINKK